MRGSFRRDQSGTSDLPLRLFAGAVVSATILAIAFGMSESVAHQAVQAWAKSAIADLHGTVQSVLSRPGTVREFTLERPTGANRVTLRLTVLGGGDGPLAAALEDERGALAGAVLCTECEVTFTGAEGPGLRLAPPTTLTLSSPRVGALSIGTVV